MNIKGYAVVVLVLSIWPYAHLASAQTPHLNGCTTLSVSTPDFFEKCQADAESGDAASQVVMSDIYEDPDFYESAKGRISKDRYKAFQWCKKADAQGYLGALECMFTMTSMTNYFSGDVDLERIRNDAHTADIVEAYKYNELLLEFQGHHIEFQLARPRCASRIGARMSSSSL